MSQQRITLFFPRISSKKTSTDKRCRFLELPYKIRRQIYFDAGMVSGMTIDMNYWSTHKRLNIYTEPFGPWDIRLPTLPLNLFAVCSSVHDELRQILYSENRLAITRTAPRGLRALERFSNATTREMRFLIIRLNLESCVHNCCGIRERRCGNGYSMSSCSNPFNTSKHDSPLSNELPSFEAFTPQWQRICAQLANARPDELALYVLCDCTSFETAEMIINPLLQIHKLQDCGLRLAREYNEKLQTLAQNTALQLTARTIPLPLPPFRYLALPKEIQLRILENTSLVSLGGAVCEWNSDRNRMFFGSSCNTRGTIHDDTGHKREFLKCFCMSGHSAFNFRCKCKGIGFPHSFFLVSRLFRELSTFVFYSRNQFRVSMEKWQRSHGEDESRKVSIRPGLSNFPQGTIHFLTYLCLDFDSYGDSGRLEIFQPTHPGFQNWLDTISLLSAHANLPILHLEIKFAEKWYREPRDALPDPDPVYEKHMQDTYERVIGPMKELKGLKNFFVHLNWSTSSTGEWGRIFGKRDGREEAEERLERMVMGRCYDAWSCGKEGCHHPEAFNY